MPSRLALLLLFAISAIAAPYQKVSNLDGCPSAEWTLKVDGGWLVFAPYAEKDAKCSDDGIWRVTGTEKNPVWKKALEVPHGKSLSWHFGKDSILVQTYNDSTSGGWIAEEYRKWKVPSLEPAGAVLVNGVLGIGCDETISVSHGKQKRELKPKVCHSATVDIETFPESFVDAKMAPWREFHLVDAPASFWESEWQTLEIGVHGATLSSEGFVLRGKGPRSGDSEGDGPASFLFDKSGKLFFAMWFGEKEVVTGRKSWIHDDHLELWLGGNDCSYQWGIGVYDGKVFKGAGDPPIELKVKAHLDPKGASGRYRIDLPKQVGKCDVTRFALVWAQGQKYLVATSDLKFGQAKTLGPLPSGEPWPCQVTGKRLVCNRPHKKVVTVTDPRPTAQLKDPVGDGAFCKVFATGVGACDYDDLKACEAARRGSDEACLPRP